MNSLLDHFWSLIQRQRQEAELERRRQQEEAASSDLLSTLQREEEEARKAVEEKRRQEEEDAKLAGNTVAIDAQAELIRPFSKRTLCNLNVSLTNFFLNLSLFSSSLEPKIAFEISCSQDNAIESESHASRTQRSTYSHRGYPQYAQK